MGFNVSIKVENGKVQITAATGELRDGTISVNGHDNEGGYNTTVSVYGSGTSKPLKMP